MTGCTRVRAAILAAMLCLLPSAAYAQWDTPNRAFHKDTAFPLDGRHQTVACASCHINGVTKGTPTTCVTCHWIRRQDDPFKTRLGSSCEQCHRTSAWSAVKWDHASATGMPLNAAHRTLDCASCHKDRVFTAANAACITCHRQDYDRTTAPNHAAAGFSTECAQCHRVSDSTFSQTRFDHNQSFPLVGLHAVQNCSACHTNGRYQGTPRTCIGCHRTDYERTTNPNHAAAGFSTGCESCHRATDPVWKGAAGSVNHAAFFPLVGQHATAGCVTCHANSRYQGTPRTCIGCHRADYDRTTSPNHAAAGYSTDCESCHRDTDASFRGAAVNHNAFFPLLGRHSTTNCAACHAGNVYKGTPRACYPCHRTEYERTANPNHIAASFPTTCEVCHNASDTLWSMGRFTHTWFPIASGRHAGNPCSACHQNPANFTQFTCLTCHTRTETDSEHQGRAGYRYESTACYACHPNGRSD
jgi:hypothetical protein